MTSFSFTDAPVVIEVPTPIVTLALHSRLRLPCLVDAVPPAKVTWTRDSQRVTSSHRTQIGQRDGEESVGEKSLTRDATLTVDHCIGQDTGVYTMIAENPAGRAQISCVVRVEGAFCNCFANVT